jgi:tetratricopeptide (TPR) repeat protein
MILQNNPTFDKAMALRDEGKYKEAADLFLDLAKSTDNLFQKAGMLLNATHSLKGAGRLDLARNQLDAVRELVSFSPDAALGAVDVGNSRKLLIGIELEDARIFAAEKKLEEALAKLNSILTDHRSELHQHSFAEIYQAVQRDRAFLLTDLGYCEEALPILEDPFLSGILLPLHGQIR